MMQQWDNCPHHIVHFCISSKITQNLHTAFDEKLIHFIQFFAKKIYKWFVEKNMLPPDSSSLTKYIGVKKVVID
jgi:hypothetical protein